MSLAAKIIPSKPEKVEDETTLSAFLERSDAFDKKNVFPTQNIRAKALLESRKCSETQLLENINRAYPLVHERLLDTINDFLEHKRNCGSKIEKAMYEGMNLVQFIDRLLVKRPLMFMGAQDKYILRDDPEHKIRAGGFEDIGTKRERAPLVMADYLTYDEMKISALLATCSPTSTINRGDRRNKGFEAEEGTFVNHAYIVGVVGSRMVKSGVMECQDIRVTLEQNSGESAFFGRDAGLGKVFAKLYDVPYFPLYSEINDLMSSRAEKSEASELRKKDYETLDCLQKGNRSMKKKLKSVEYFNTHICRERTRLTAETFLMEANHRAREAGKKAYVHLVGLGLGVWKVTDLQQQLYVDVFGQSLKKLNLEHISDLDISWIPVDNCVGVVHGKVIPNTSTRLHISKRDPYEPLPGPAVSEDKVVVVSWAYDSNSYPGNEYWKGQLAGSGDSAAAACTQITELHNPAINLKMRGANLRIALEETGNIVTVKEYYDKIHTKK